MSWLTNASVSKRAGFGQKVDLKGLENRVKSALDSLGDLPKIAERVQQALAETPPDDLDTIAEERRIEGEALCIALEFLAGVETPKVHQQERMDYQVGRLSKRMSGEKTPSMQDEGAALERDWYGCGPMTPAVAQGLQERVATALAKLDEARLAVHGGGN